MIKITLPGWWCQGSFYRHGGDFPHGWKPSRQALEGAGPFLPLPKLKQAGPGPGNLGRRPGEVKYTLQMIFSLTFLVSLL
jgi:hypothetical protein